MSRLNRIVKQKETNMKQKKKKKKTTIPVYDMDGRTITPEKKKREHRLAVLLLILTALFAFIYLPGFFMNGRTSEENITVTPDVSAIRMSNNALRDNPEEDFDGDGVSNSDESSAGTSPYNVDTDGDGATDYYELNISDTAPLSANDLLSDAQTRLDRENEKNVGSPYKIGNVILWADDYESKSHGSVVETTTGYRFCDFSGYAQFTAEDEGYAYQLEDGVRTLLPYRENENAWRIESDMTVELYDEPLEEIVEFNFFFQPVYAPSNTATDILAVILPDKGFVTASRKMRIDVEPDTRENTVIDIEKPIFDSTDDTRFTMNSNTLNDLQFVRETIREEGCCVAVSLFNSEYGEYLGIIYGYTFEGDLLIAEMNTLEPIGTLNVTEKARKILDDSGEIVSMSYFDFSGFGFDSENGDRISFFAASASTVEDIQSPSGFGEKTDSGRDKEQEENTQETSGISGSVSGNSELQTDTEEQEAQSSGLSSAGQVPAEQQTAGETDDTAQYPDSTVPASGQPDASTLQE